MRSMTVFIGVQLAPSTQGRCSQVYLFRPRIMSLNTLDTTDDTVATVNVADKSLLHRSYLSYALGCGPSGESYRAKTDNVFIWEASQVPSPQAALPSSLTGRTATATIFPPSLLPTAIQQPHLVSPTTARRYLLTTSTSSNLSLDLRTTTTRATNPLAVGLKPPSTLEN